MLHSLPTHTYTHKVIQTLYKHFHNRFYKGKDLFNRGLFSFPTKYLISFAKIRAGYFSLVSYRQSSLPRLLPALNPLPQAISL